MARSDLPRGYTLIEVIVAILVFGVGVLALAASSAIVARAMAANALRERSGRIASSRIELVHSECRIAGSGEDRSPQILSEWVVARSTLRSIAIEETVTYSSSGGPRTDTYRAAVWCP